MATLVFLLHFDANLTGTNFREFMQRLELTDNRVDDWDRLLGFRLVGTSGAIRLFLSPAGDSPSPDHDDWYDLTGTATESRDRVSLQQMYEECVAAIRSIGGRIDERHVVRPPGIAETNPSGSGETSN